MAKRLTCKLVVEGRVVRWDREGNPYLDERPVLVVVEGVEMAAATLRAVLRRWARPGRWRGKGRVG
jgi:hypothetical protein